jgi:hypothetical protein
MLQLTICIGSSLRVCAALLAVRWRFRRDQCRNVTIVGSLRRCKLVEGLHREAFRTSEIMTCRTNCRGPIFAMARPQFVGVADLPDRRFDEHGEGVKLKDPKSWPPQTSAQRSTWRSLVPVTPAFGWAGADPRRAFGCGLRCDEPGRARIDAQRRHHRWQHPSRLRHHQLAFR